MQAQMPDKDVEEVISIRDRLHDQLASPMAVELD